MSPKVKKGSRSRARRVLLQALYQWSMTAESPHEIEAQFVAERPMDNVDLEYFQALLHAIPKQTDELDQRLSPSLDRPMEQLDPIEHSVLRIGCYELMHRKEVPLRVVINEAIELAKLFGAEQSHKYINGILDKVARDTRQEGL